MSKKLSPLSPYALGPNVLALSSSGGAQLEQSVWVSPADKMNHKSGCEYLDKKRNSIPISQAKSEGYSACSRCFASTVLKAPGVRQRFAQSHPRQWVDRSGPAYNERERIAANPTHGSGWIVQVLPIKRRSTNLCPCGASHKVGGECSEATGRQCLDDPRELGGI